MFKNNITTPICRVVYNFMSKFMFLDGVEMLRLMVLIFRLASSMYINVFFKRIHIKFQVGSKLKKK